MWLCTTAIGLITTPIRTINEVYLGMISFRKSQPKLVQFMSTPTHIKYLVTKKYLSLLDWHNTLIVVPQIWI